VADVGNMMDTGLPEVDGRGGVVGCRAIGNVRYTTNTKTNKTDFDYFTSNQKDK
jgi:hypothetical protein